MEPVAPWPSCTNDVDDTLRRWLPRAPWRVAAWRPPGPMPTASTEAWDGGP